MSNVCQYLKLCPKHSHYAQLCTRLFAYPCTQNYASILHQGLLLVPYFLQVHALKIQAEMFLPHIVCTRFMDCTEADHADKLNIEHASMGLASFPGRRRNSLATSMSSNCIWM